MREGTHHWYALCVCFDCALGWVLFTCLTWSAYIGTVQHFAAADGDTSLVTLLLEKRANVDAVTSTKRNTPLHSAAEKGHVEVLELLVPAGAKVDAVNAAGHTPLLMAASYGHVDFIRALLKHGASPRRVDKV